MKPFGSMTNWFVVIAFALTAAASVAFWQARQIDIVREYTNEYCSRREQVNAAIEKACAIDNNVQGYDDDQLRSAAAQIVSETTEQELLPVLIALEENVPTRRARRLIVFLAEEGARRWDSPTLTLRAGSEYRQGRFVPRDEEKALGYLTAPSLTSGLWAFLELGKLYLDPGSPRHDEIRGLTYLLRSAAGGVPAAATELGAALQGYDDDKLRETAARIVAESSQEEMEAPLSSLETRLEERKAQQLAVFLAEEGARQWNSAPLMLQAGSEYRSGRQVAKDHDKALGYLTDPAIVNDPWAFLELGELYLDPDSPRHDETKGLEYLLRSAARGVEAAAERAGAALQDRDDEELHATAVRIVADSSPEALELPLVSLEGKIEEPKAQQLVVFLMEEGARRWNSAPLMLQAGSEYRGGRHVAKDHDKALGYLTDPSLAGDLWAFLELGKLYLDPGSPRHDEIRGLTYLIRSAAGGVSAAVTELGTALQGYDDDKLREVAARIVAESTQEEMEAPLSFLETRVEDRKARQLAVLLAEEGARRWNSAPLMLQAGSEYRSGRHVAKDHDKALGYLTDPSLAGDLWAFLELGKLYLDPGSPRHDEIRGLTYLIRSAAGGVSAAVTELGTALQGYDDDDKLRETAARIVAESAQEEMETPLSFLETRVEDRKARQLAVLLAEEGARRWNSAPLMLQAGSEYRSGRHVAKDHDKALGYLTDPAIVNNPWAFLELGELYLDPASPHHDEAKGLDYLRRSSAGGVGLATERLKQFDADGG